MAAKKTNARKAATGKRGSPAGIVRFKVGFPAGFREALRRRYGDDWHLSLQILDGDDGDGDDGDGDDGSAGGAAGRKAAKRARAAPAKKRASKSAAKRGTRK